MYTFWVDFSHDTNWSEICEEYPNKHLIKGDDMIQKGNSIILQSNIKVRNSTTERQKGSRSEIKRGVYLVKRLEDILTASFALILTGWLMILIAIAVKLTSKGPILFKQKRLGKDGKEFDLIKFRSMKADAEAESGPIWAKEGKGATDPRVTVIGNFLRKSHFDEFPQFFLVLKGTMSLIGPRPERPEFVKELKTIYPFYTERLTGLKPGVTGIAQMNREKDESFKKTAVKLISDHTYGILISQSTPLGALWLDLKILLTTIKNIVI